jgi:hypothetical protein
MNNNFGKNEGENPEKFVLCQGTDGGTSETGIDLLPLAGRDTGNAAVQPLRKKKKGSQHPKHPRKETRAVTCGECIHYFLRDCMAETAPQSSDLICPSFEDE